MNQLPPSTLINLNNLGGDLIDDKQWHLSDWIDNRTLELIEQDSQRASILTLTLRFNDQGECATWSATTLRVVGGFAVEQLEGETLDATECTDGLPTPDEVNALLIEIMRIPSDDSGEIGSWQ